MANTPLNIDVKVNGQKQIDNLNRSLGRTTKSTIDLGSALRLAGAAFAAIGIGKFAKDIIGVGRTVENLQLRFKFLFNSAEEGSKAFDTLSEFAGTVPFSLEQIAAASGNLAVVSKDAEELRDNLEITANVAAISGLDFQVAGEQIQRALSSGISAADLLRERGVKNLLGFKDGVTVTAEETAERFAEVFGPDGEFGGAAVAMAGTLDGLSSMVGDKFFNIKRIISDSGPFDALKAVVGVLDEAMTKNFENIEKAAQNFGQAIVTQAKLVLIGGAQILDALQPVTDFVAHAFNNILRATAGLPGIIKTFGVIGFLALGLTGKAIVIAVAAVADDVIKIFTHMIDFLAAGKEKLAGFLDAIGLSEAAEKMRKNANDMRTEAKQTRDAIDGIGDGAKSAEVKLEDFMEMLETQLELLGENTRKAGEYIKMFEAMIKKQKEMKDEIDASVGANKKQDEGFKDLTITVGSFREALNKTMAEMLEKFEPAQEAVNVLIGSFNTFKKGVGDAFADAILGAKSFGESIKALATTILHQLISGIVQLGVQIIVFRLYQKYVDSSTNSVKKLNSQLQKQIGLTLFLNAITGGGGSFIGSLMGRATGGPVGANAPVVVGERGPEIFVPNSSGTVIPNNQLGMSADAQTGDITENINVTFNITTLDAADFNQLLESRQDLIIGLINRGLAERGKRSLTA